MPCEREPSIDQPENSPSSGGLAAVRQELDLSAEATAWLADIDPPVGSPGPVLPDDAAAEQQLERLGIDEADRLEVLDSRPDPHAHPALWWVLERACHKLRRTMGECAPIEGHTRWPVRFSPWTGPVGRHLPVWMYLSILPDVRHYHAERDIPDDVSWKSLAGLAAVMGKHRSVTGHSGIGLFGFGTSAVLLFRGAQYRLGQLEFSRGAISLSDGPCGYALSVHVPPVRPLDPTACDDALTYARTFFPRHFPEEPVTFFTCSSWLLDPQLAEYLPEHSRIIQFQRRFHLIPAHTEAELPAADGDVAEYVFGRTHHDLDAYPQDTTLHRAYVAHLRSGRHWHERTGWLPFP